MVISVADHGWVGLCVCMCVSEQQNRSLADSPNGLPLISQLSPQSNVDLDSQVKFHHFLRQIKCYVVRLVRNTQPCVNSNTLILWCHIHPLSVLSPSLSPFSPPGLLHWVRVLLI